MPLQGISMGSTPVNSKYRPMIPQWGSSNFNPVGERGCSYGGLAIIFYLLVLIVPAASALVAGLGGRYIGDKGAGFLTTACMGLACMLAAVIYIEVV